VTSIWPRTALGQGEIHGCKPDNTIHTNSERAKIYQKLSVNYANSLAALDGSILLLVEGNLPQSLILIDTAIELLLRARIESEGRFRRPVNLNAPSRQERMTIVRREAPPARPTAQWPDFNDLFDAFERWAPAVATNWRDPLSSLHRERNGLQHARADPLNSSTEARLVRHMLETGVPFIDAALADEGISLSICCNDWYREFQVARQFVQHGRQSLVTLAFRMRYLSQWHDQYQEMNREETSEMRRREYSEILRRETHSCDIVDLTCRVCFGRGLLAVCLGTYSESTGETCDSPEALGFCCPDCGFGLLRDKPQGILNAHLQMTAEEWDEIMKDTR
jgi:hypothetical protein